MVYRGIPGGTFLLIAINILAGTLIDAFPHGYARPSQVKGAGAGAGMPYGEGAPPSVGGEYPNGKGGNGQYYGMKGGNSMQ